MKPETEKLIKEMEKAKDNLAMDAYINKIISETLLVTMNKILTGETIIEKAPTLRLKISREYTQWNSSYQRCKKEVELYSECIETLRKISEEE